jgi:palmitoyltransferase
MAVVVAWGQMSFLANRNAPSNFPGTGAMGLYLGTKCMFFTYFFYELWPYLWGPQALVGYQWDLAAVIFSVGVWYNWLKAHVADPGFLDLGIGSPNVNKLIIGLAEANELNRDTFCLTCACRKPFRSKHCSVTNRCVAKFDHYCPFVGNCIGSNNHRYFMLFVMNMPFLVITYLILCKRYMELVCPDPGNWYEVPMAYGTCRPFATWTIANGCLHTMWTTGLGLAQLNQIAGDYTTNEAMNRWRYNYLQQGPPWSKGVCGNFLEFFRPFGTTIDWKKTFELPNRK